MSLEKSDLGGIPPLPELNGHSGLESEPMPGSTPQPEPEIWTCRMAGCPKQIITKGAERQKEIEDHAGEHDWETQMRVELVETEQRMHTALPVSNLMKYLISQHYQQMREAFPEVYFAEETRV
jgi:hypothetical protein